MVHDVAMSAEQAAVWAFLLAHFEGEAAAAPRVTVLQRFNMAHAGKDISDREFREIISQLVSVFGKPIATTPAAGYFVARTQAELQKALNYLDSVITQVAERRRALAGSRPTQVQEELF